jgi:hypothetical protein
MNVTFTRTGERRYRVSVEGPGIEPSYMDPAPGYDERLPHDAAHFIVENELGINGGVFGQLAAGGTANTFRCDTSKKPRKTKKRGREMAKANRDDALFSEHAVYAAQSRWEKQDIIPDTKIQPADIERIIVEFEAFAAAWEELPVGGSVTLLWKQKARPAHRRRLCLFFFF